MPTAITLRELEDGIAEALPELMDASVAELFNQVCRRKIAYKADSDYFVELRLNESEMCVYCGEACWEPDEEAEDGEEASVCEEQFEDAPAEEDYRGTVNRQDMPDDVGFVYDNT
jgi:hypothetical protein